VPLQLWPAKSTLVTCHRPYWHSKPCTWGLGTGGLLPANGGFLKDDASSGPLHFKVSTITFREPSAPSSVPGSGFRAVHLTVPSESPPASRGSGDFSAQPGVTEARPSSTMGGG
jgi:hypothetical protein